MSDNVIKITKKKKSDANLWMCGCGCMQFFIHEHNGIECCSCNDMNQMIQAHIKEEKND
jgi:hypothetical protein